jgi:hypothetical protein
VLLEPPVAEVPPVLFEPPVAELPPVLGVPPEPALPPLAVVPPEPLPPLELAPPLPPEPVSSFGETSQPPMTTTANVVIARILILVCIACSMAMLPPFDHLSSHFVSASLAQRFDTAGSGN